MVVVIHRYDNSRNRLISGKVSLLKWFVIVNLTGNQGNKVYIGLFDVF